MGTNSFNSFILYVDKSEQNQEKRYLDQISLDLPEGFHKSKIFETIYLKHRFHECILTLEYFVNGILNEYKDDIVDKKKLFKDSKKAYIKISNGGKCKCKEQNRDKENLNEIKEEPEKIFEYKKKIKEMENELEKEIRKRLELENKLYKEKEINTQIENYSQLELKLKLVEKEIEKLKIEKSLNEYKINNIDEDKINTFYDSKIEKFKNTFDKFYLKEDSENNACPPLSSYIKTNCFLIECNKEYEESITKYEKEEIYPNIKTLIKNTYSNLLKDLRYEDFQNNIFNILNFDDSMYYSIKKKLEENLFNICHNISKTKHFNIVLLGREGVGKSTLLNSVLKLEGKNMAKTGEGDSVTLEIKRYSNSDPKINFLRLYDTQGIGIKEENSAEKILSNIFKLIQEQIFKEDSNPDDLIHCLWFCFNGRFGDKEMEILKKLSETYSDKTLPFIIVHTKTFSKSVAKKEIKNIIETYKIPKEKICQVLARDEDDDEDEDEDGDEDEDKSKKK